MKKQYIESVVKKNLTAVQRDFSSYFPKDAKKEDRYIDVRVQKVDGLIKMWYGDNSFDTDHRGAWGVGILTEDSDIKELSEELVEDLLEFEAVMS